MFAEYSGSVCEGQDETRIGTASLQARKHHVMQRCVFGSIPKGLCRQSWYSHQSVKVPQTIKLLMTSMLYVIGSNRDAATGDNGEGEVNIQ